MSPNRRSTPREHPSLSLVSLPDAEAATLPAATSRHPSTRAEPAVAQTPGLLAMWCSSVGSTWTLELHTPTQDTTLGPLVDWITSEVPTSEPEPDEALAHALLAQHGLRLSPDTDAGPRTHTRRSIGYVNTPTPSLDASAAAARPTSGAPDTVRQAAVDGMPAPAGTIPSPSSSPPDAEPWTTERLHALLLRVVRATDLGLLLSQDADWIRAQIRAASHAAPPQAPPIREHHSTR